MSRKTELINVFSLVILLALTTGNAPELRSISRSQAVINSLSSSEFTGRVYGISLTL